jgi:hypothetical protein
MRFPLRLTVDLTFGVAARAIRLRLNPPLISPVSPEGNAHTSSPIVWIAGVKPLEHPEVARMANALAAARRHVFLPADGVLLRRRIHEFQPTSRLHLTFRFDGTQASHDRRAGREGAFQAALEGIRAAKLSGFLICACLILHADSDGVELAILHAELRKLDLDGFLISPAARTIELERSAADARRRLLSRRWALLSRLLDSATMPAMSAESSQVPRNSVVELPQASCEEGVQAP